MPPGLIYQISEKMIVFNDFWIPISSNQPINLFRIVPEKQAYRLASIFNISSLRFLFLIIYLYESARCLHPGVIPTITIFAFLLICSNGA